MNLKPRLVAHKFYDTLVNGRQVDRAAAQSAIVKEKDKVVRAELRKLILEALSEEFKYAGQREFVEPELRWARTWLLSTLARICDDDSAAAKELRKHLYPEFEDDLWARYWTLEGLVVAEASDLKDLAEKIAAREDSGDLVLMLALGILASNKDNKALKKIHEGLENKGPFPIKERKRAGGGPTLLPDRWQWATLRALRVVPIDSTVNSICEILNTKYYSDDVYEAIVALGQIPKTSPHVEIAATTISGFLMKHLDESMYDGMRTAAIVSLGNLGVETSAPILVKLLADDNPAIVREAARSLEKILEVRDVVSRVVNAARKAGKDHTKIYADALRSVEDRDAVANELEYVMLSGQTDQQDTARLLLSEIGGTVALSKLRARTSSMEQFMNALEKAEEKIRVQFETSIREARTGFKLATFMDMVVFFIGVVLIIGSAWMALSTGQTEDFQSWAGVGATGGIGVLGVLYGVLIRNPRRQVRESVDHLMFLKVVFLAYLRQLHQADQAYSRRLLEDEKLTPGDVESFSKMVNEMMRNVVEQLALSKVPAQDTVGEKKEHGEAKDGRTYNGEENG